jgi:DNA polymerase-3 subunit gamma/tau
MARLDRLERRMTISGGDPSPAPAAVTEPASVEPAPHVLEPTVIEPVRPPRPEPEATTDPEPATAAETPAVEPATAATTAAGSTLTLVDVRRLWPDIVEATKQRRRLTWIYLTQQAQVVAVDDKSLTLGFANAGARDSFDSGGSAEIVRQAAIDVVGHDWRVETIVDPGADAQAVTPTPAAAASQTPAAPASSAPPAEPAGHQLGTPPVPEPGTSQPPDWAAPEAADASVAVPADVPAEPAESPSASARQAIAKTRGRAEEELAEPVDPDGGARHDDTDAESSGVDGAKLLEEALGAQVIDEIPHQ